MLRNLMKHWTQKDACARAHHMRMQHFELCYQPGMLFQFCIHKEWFPSELKRLLFGAKPLIPENKAVRLRSTLYKQELCMD